MNKRNALFLSLVLMTHSIYSQIYTSEIKVQDTQGNVGIGIANPRTKLHVGGEMYIHTNNDAIVTFNNDDNSSQYLQFKQSDLRKAWMGLDGANNFQINKEGGGNIILNGGNVGIGTQSVPSAYRLSVNGLSTGQNRAGRGIG